MGETRKFKMVFMVVSAVLAASLIINIYFYTQQYGVTTPNIELENQLTTLQSQLDSLETTHQDYVGTHNHSNSDYDNLTLTHQNYASNHTRSDSEYNLLQSQVTNLENQVASLQSQLNALEIDYEALIVQSILPPYTLISGRNVTWAFELSNGELHTLHMPIDYYRDEIALEKPKKYLQLTDYHDQTWTIMDFRPFIGYGAFDTFAQEIYDQIGDDKQFIYEMWNIVAQLTVYSSEITETPRWPLETLTEGGGDCEDTAILVASLLQEIERFTVELVYIDSNNPLDPHTFNHVIVWVDTGTYQTYIETTSKTTMNPYDSGVHGWGFQV